jgi:hypothetical protein
VQVRFVARDAIRRQLDNENIVLLSNLGFTAGGEVLNCNTYDVGLHASIELNADKLICLHLSDVTEMRLPAWLPLSRARDMLLQRLMGHVSTASIDVDEADKLRRQLLQDAQPPPANGSSSNSSSGGGLTSSASSSSISSSSSSNGSLNGSSNGANGSNGGRDCLLNLDLWTDTGFPTAVAVAVVACVKGVKRAHLIDARMDGGMLLELYSRCADLSGCVGHKTDKKQCALCAWTYTWPQSIGQQLQPALIVLQAQSGAAHADRTIACCCSAGGKYNSRLQLQLASLAASCDLRSMMMKLIVCSTWWLGDVAAYAGRA